MQSPDDEIIPAQLPLNNNQSVLSPATTSVSAASAASTESSATVNELSINRRVTAGFYTNSPNALAALPPSAAESIREFRLTPIPSASLVAASKVTVEKLSVREDITAQVMLDASKKDKEDLSKEGKSPTVVKSKNYYSAGVMVLVPEASSPDLKTAKNKLWNEPSNNLAYFQREALEAEITRVLSFQVLDKTKKNVPLSRRIITLYGLSGTGKTQLAVKTLYQLSADSANYITSCWFDAKNISTIKDQYANFAKEMNIVSAETPVELAYKKAKDWLKQNPRSLLIFDNAEDYKTLSEYLPNSGVDILITSLNNNWPGTLIEVPVFNLSTGEEYVKFLLESDDENIARLVNKFGGHPLALAQAAAYIKGKETVASYLKHYEIIKAKLLEDQSLPPDSEHEPIAISWYRIMQAIKQESEDALEILYICAFLHGDNIPEKFIKIWIRAKLSHAEAHEISEARLKTNSWQKLHKFKNFYTKYSILRINNAKKSFAMHKLLRDVIRRQVHKIKKEELLKNLLQVIYSTFAKSTHDKKFFQLRHLYIPHLESLVESCEEINLENIDYYLACLNALGVAYVKAEDRHKKKAILLKALTVIKNTKTAKPLSTAKVLLNLSFACQDLQEYKDAESYLNESLSLVSIAFKQKSTEMLESTSDESKDIEQIILACNINLGLIQIELRNYHKSIENLNYVLGRCLELSDNFRKRMEGDGEPFFNSARPSFLLRPSGVELIYANDVGLPQACLDRYGSNSKGKPNYKSYDFSELLLIITLTHLGNVYYQKGLKENDLHSFLRAKAYLDKALQFHAVEGNKMHPARAITFMHLGKVHQQLRLFTFAEANFINSVRITKHVFGDSHLDMVRFFNNLYELYKQVGEYQLAIECLNCVLSISAHYFTDNSEEIIKLRNEKEICQALLSKTQLEGSQPNKGIESVKLHVEKLMTLDFADENKAPVKLSKLENIDENLLNVLIKNLSDDDADIRQSSAETLIKLGRIDARVLEALIKNLSHNDWSMRNNIVKILEELGEINNPKVFDTYVNNLSSPHRSVRQEAVIELKKAGKLRISSVINVIINNLSSDDHSIRREAAIELETMGKSNCTDVINAHIKNLASKNTRLRQESAEILIKLYKAQQETPSRFHLNLESSHFSRMRSVRRLSLNTLPVVLNHEATITPDEFEQAKQEALATCVRNLEIDDPCVRGRAAIILIEHNIALEKVVDALILNLDDEDHYWRASYELLEKLGKSDDPRVINIQINNLNSDNSSKVFLSIDALCKAGKAEQKVINTCMKNLNSNECLMLEYAAAILLKLAKIDNKAIEILFDRLNNDDYWIVRSAEDKLIQWGKVNPLVVDFLINQLNVCAATVKGKIAWILGRIGNTEEKVKKSLFTHLYDEDVAISQSIAEALIDLKAENDQAVEIFTKSAKDPSVFCRRRAMNNLGKVCKPNDKVIEILSHGLADEDSYVRDCAENSLKQLEKMDDLRVHDACLINLKSKHYKVKQFSIEMIGKYKIFNDQLFDELIKCLNDDFLTIPRNALKTIEKLGKSADPKVIATHIANSSHTNPEVRLSSVEALNQLDDANDDVVNALNRCLNDEDDSVRRAARYKADCVEKSNRIRKQLEELMKKLEESREVEGLDPKKNDGNNEKNTQSRHTIFSDKQSHSSTPKKSLPLPSQDEIQRNYLISLTKQNKNSDPTDEDDDLPDAIEMRDPSLHDSEHDSDSDDESRKQQRP